MIFMLINKLYWNKRVTLPSAWFRCRGFASKLLATGWCVTLWVWGFSQQKDSVRLQTDSTPQVNLQELLIKQQQGAQADSVMRAHWEAVLSEQAGDKKRKAVEISINKVLAEDSARSAKEKRRVDSLRKVTIGYPVILLTDTLFKMYIGIGSFDAKARAKAISERIEKIYDAPSYNKDSFKIVDNGEDLSIVYGDLNILSVTKLDALWLRNDRQRLAEKYKDIMAATVASVRNEYSFQNRMRRIFVSILAVGGLWLLAILIGRLFQAIERFAWRHKDKYFKGVTIKKFELLSASMQLSLFGRLLRLTRIAFTAFVIYVVLSFLFGLFPKTMTWTNTLLHWILNPAKSVWHAFVGFLPNLFTILVIYLVFSYVIKLIRYFALEISDGKIRMSGFHSDWASPTFNILRFLLYAFMLVVMFPYLPGSHSPAFQGVSVFLGLLFSIGSSSAISNIVAGLVITYMRPFKLGDRVKIGEVVGDVIEKNMLVTRVRTAKNEDITIPNSSILSGSTINFSGNTNPQDEGLIVHTTVTIGYDTPWMDITAALVQAAKRTKFILASPEPFVLQTSLDDFYVSYQLNAYTKNASAQSVIYSELHRHIQDCCNEANIEIMSPHYRAERDGSASTIPKNKGKENEAGGGLNTLS